MLKTTNYMQKQIRIAVYVRVSTQEQAKEGYSIGEQTDRLKKYADAHGWTVVKVYTDAGHSGANQDRPALQDMITDVKDRKIDKVLVYKLDRLSRSQKDTLELIEDVFLANDCDFESMTEKFDTSTSFGRAMVGILAVFAQLEREQIRERMSMGMEARIKEGKWKGGCKIPFGYDYEAALDKLVINDYEAMIVKSIFEAFTEGTNLYNIKKDMYDKGYTFRSGNLDPRNIKYVLRNKTYCGYLKSRNQWYKGLHDPIIDEATYEKAQEILEETKRKFDESGIKIESTARSTNLGGLLYCSHCGAKYCKVSSGTKKYGYHYNYKCYSRNKKVKHMVKDPNCKNKIYRVEKLDEIIFNEIKKLSIDPEYLKVLRKEAEKVTDQQKINGIQDELKSIDAQLSRFMDLYGLGKYDMEQLDAKTKPLAEKKLKLQKELAKLKEQSSHITDKEVLQKVESFEEALENGSLQDRRAIIEALINRIDIDNEDITIHWNFL